VFNMSGGILAWNGHLLPAVPNLKAFDLSGDEKAILHRAMDLERGADRFYTALRDRFQPQPWAESLDALAGAEESHARLIYTHWAALVSEPPPFALLYASLTGDIVEGGYSCEALLTMLVQQVEPTCRSVLEMALTVEYAAYDLSRNLAHRFQDGPLAAVFNSIAEAEKQHMHLVAQALAHCTEG